MRHPSTKLSNWEFALQNARLCYDGHIQEEYEADSHGVVILKRANYDGKQVMGNTLTWLLKTAGPSGGFFENHPGTDDRIQRIHDLS